VGLLGFLVLACCLVFCVCDGVVLFGVLGVCAVWLRWNDKKFGGEKREGD